MIKFTEILKGIRLRGVAVDPIDNVEGSLWFNSALSKIKGFFGGTSHEITTNDQVQTLTNKTIDASQNTITNIPITSFQTGIIDTDGTLAADSDSRIATQKATKTYADTKVPQTTTVNGHPLSSNVVVTKSDILTGNLIVNADVDPAAGIVESKLSLDFSTASLHSEIVVLTPVTYANLEGNKSLANNQTNVALGLSFSSYKSARILGYIVINATASLYETVDILIVKRGADYKLSQSGAGDESLVRFDIDASGAILYTSGNYAGFTSGNIQYQITALI